MQLVLSNNRIIAHGENFLVMGGVVINTETGRKYENATVAECNGCPSDIDEVGYEYHAGVFVPCAPFGKGNNNGCFMEVCADCATPRSSGIPIKGGIKLENLHSEVADALRGRLVWTNASMGSNFEPQTVRVDLSNYERIKVITKYDSGNSYNYYFVSELLYKNVDFGLKVSYQTQNYIRPCQFTNDSVIFGHNYTAGSMSANNSMNIPYQIIGYKYF